MEERIFRILEDRIGELELDIDCGLLTKKGKVKSFDEFVGMFRMARILGVNTSRLNRLKSIAENIMNH